MDGQLDEGTSGAALGWGHLRARLAGFVFDATSRSAASLARRSSRSLAVFGRGIGLSFCFIDDPLLDLMMAFLFEAVWKFAIGIPNEVEL
jgi:hypothetical protein